MVELINYLEEVVIPILERFPPPELGEWNYPQIIRELRVYIDKARKEVGP